VRAVSKEGDAMKEDVPERPERVPRKRRQIEDLLAIHLAEFLALDTITPSERRLLEKEKARRKALVPDNPVGLLVGQEGVTPQQLDGVQRVLAESQPTEIHHPFTAGRLHTLCRSLGVPVHVHRDVRRGMEDVIRQSLAVVALPRERSESFSSSPVWEMIRRAKHRKVAVHIVLPDGRVTRPGRDS
jgi:hypothetical protein